MTTVAAIAADMADEAGENYSGDADVKIQWDNWCLEAIEEVVGSGRWFSSNFQETITTVSGTRTYALDVLVGEVRAIEKPGGGMLPYGTIDRLISRSLSLTAAGVPTSWYVDSIDSSQKILIGMQPVPNAIIVYELFAVKRPPVLTEASTVPLGLDFERPIRYLIRAKSKFNENQIEASSMAQQAADAAIGLLNARYVEPPKPGSKLPSGNQQQLAQLPLAR